MKDTNICEICNDPFDDEEWKWKRCIHHIDGNHENDILENRMNVHISCHSRLHVTGSHRSDATKEKISEALKNPSEELRMRISKALTGKHHTRETKEKISKSNSGSNNPFYGKYHSEETKKRMSHTAFGREYSKETRMKMSIAATGRKQSMETKARKKLSYEVGKENYSLMEIELLWNGERLININEIWDDILQVA